MAAGGTSISSSDDPDALGARLVAELAAVNVGGTPVFVAGGQAADLVGLSMLLLVESVRRLVRFDDSDAHAAIGYRSAVDHLVHTTGCSSERAHQLIRVVRFCSTHPATGRALYAGEVSFDQLDVIARYAHDLADEYGADEARILDLCADRTVDELRRQIRLWRWRVAPDAGADDTERAWDRRSCSLRHSLFGGVSGSFDLDAVGGQLLADALDTPPDRDGPVPARTLRQRRADALVDLAAGHLFDDELGEDAGADDVAADTETGPDGSDSEPGPISEAGTRLTDTADGESGPTNAPERRPVPSGRRSTPVIADVVIDITSLTGDPIFDIDRLRAELAQGGALSPQIVEQLVCDASLRRVLFDGPSLVLDVGEATPIIPTALRRAIQIRDRHCQFAGCTAPWHWCDIHHLVPLAEGGLTVQVNLVLLCRRHHSMCHQAGWQIGRNPETGEIHTRSPGHRTETNTGDQPDWVLDHDLTWVRPPPPERQPTAA